MIMSDPPLKCMAKSFLFREREKGELKEKKFFLWIAICLLVYSEMSGSIQKPWVFFWIILTLIEFWVGQMLMLE